MHDAYLGVGGNLGDRLQNLTEAVRRLHATPGIRVASVSSVYESTAVGMTAQPDFLNLVAHVTTDCSPAELLAHCLRIEGELGRVRRERWGPRTVDIDVLLYNDVVLSDPALTIPHPRMLERSFVLVPLAEIAPQVRVNGNSIAALAAQLDRAGLVKSGGLDWMAEPPRE